MTGAELVGVCQEAKIRVLREMTAVLDETTNKGGGGEDIIQMKQEYIVDALKGIKPLLSDPEALKEFGIFEKSTVKR
jgi:hypothetical protein